MSANRIAREAGVSWGTLKHQFGDIDGLWAAVLTELTDRSGADSPEIWPRMAGSIRERVWEMVDAVWTILETPEGRAVETLRAGLPHGQHERLEVFPLTTVATIVNHDGPAGKWPVLYHQNGLDEAPPIGFVAVGPKTLELAGEIGDFVVLHTFFSDEATANSVAAVRRGAERAGKDPDSVRIWSCLATASDALSEADQLRRRTGRLVTYLQAYADILISANGWDPLVWERIRAPQLFQDAAAAGPIDASASVEVLEQFDALIPDEWLDSAAYGTPEQCVRKISREYDLGCHSVIMHGASPHELESVVETYRANRPTLRRAVAANPGKFA